MSNSKTRKEAYDYTRELISNRQCDLSGEADYPPVIPLNDLMLLRDGSADPSIELVASLRELLKGQVSDEDINQHLIAPFQARNGK